MTSVIKRFSPRAVDADEQKHLVNAMEERTGSLGDRNLDIGYNQEQDERIPTEDVNKSNNDSSPMPNAAASSIQGNSDEISPLQSTRRSPSVFQNPSLLLFSPSPKIPEALLNSAAPSKSRGSMSVRKSVSMSIRKSLYLPPPNLAVDSPNLEPSPEALRFQSEWKFDEGKLVSTDGFNHYARDVDLIDELKRGAVLLKFGAKGKPHFRYFALNSKLDTLIWMSGSKKFEETQIALKDISDIKFGLGDKGLKVKGSTKYRNLGFTIVYNNYQETLELLAKDSEELQIWVNGMIACHNATKAGLPVPEHCPATILISADHPMLFKQPQNNMEKCRKEVLKMRAKFNELNAIAEAIVAPYSDLVVEDVKEDLHKLESCIEDKSSQLADLEYKAWLLAVKLEALDHILKTPHEPSPSPVRHREVDDMVSE